MKGALRRINKKVLALALPSILANITIPLVGMVDLGVAGRLGDVVAIGGMAISTMLFDLLYWNMGFLRVGTGGMVAQAYGRKDYQDIMNLFVQGLMTALCIAAVIWIIQYFYVEIALSIIPCSKEVAALAKQYYYIRIWAAPATLSLFVFRGFFIGMQNAVCPMIVDVTINVVNLGLSIWLALNLHFGFVGIAYAVTAAQYTGMILSIILVTIYYRRLFKYINLKVALKLKRLKRFFGVNGNLFLRSICFLFIYTGFTSFSANYGDELLAVNTIMMKMLLLYSFFLDGFDYAGEALSGKSIGEQNAQELRLTVKAVFMWGVIISAASTLCYIFGSRFLIGLLTNDVQVINDSVRFYPWLWIMPALSFVAFTWDGIYIGATATRSIRNCMFASVVGFYLCYYLFKGVLGVQVLYLAYMVHAVIRSVWLTLTAKKQVYSKIK